MADVLLPKSKPFRDEDHKSFVRSLPCCVCGRAPCDAAHVRKGTDGAMGMKPSDRYVVPLCSAAVQWQTPPHVGCHSRQHNIGEGAFWYVHGDPLPLAEHLWKISGDLEAGIKAVQRFQHGLEMR